jgi:hypothetical protein
VFDSCFYSASKRKKLVFNIFWTAKKPPVEEKQGLEIDVKFGHTIEHAIKGIYLYISGTFDEV